MSNTDKLSPTIKKVEKKKPTPAEERQYLQGFLNLKDPITDSKWETLKAKHKKVLDDFRKTYAAASNVANTLTKSISGLFNDLESQEILKPKGYERKFKSGRYGINRRDLMPGQKPTAPEALVDKKGPLTVYEIRGEADKERHREVNNGSRWYKEKQEAAMWLIKIFGGPTKGEFDKSLKVEGFSNPKRLHELAELLRTKPDYCTYQGLKKLIIEKKATRDEIYGPSGILNFLLAFQRSVSPLVKKGKGYKELGNMLIPHPDPKQQKGACIRYLTLKLNERKVVVTKAKDQPGGRKPNQKPKPDPDKDKKKKPKQNPDIDQKKKPKTDMLFKKKPKPNPKRPSKKPVSTITPTPYSWYPGRIIKKDEQNEEKDK